MAGNNITVDIFTESSKWDSVNLSCSLQDLFEKCIRAVVEHPDTPTLPSNLTVSVLLTNDEHIKLLNNNYRKKNKPTNILSFPQQDSLENLKEIPYSLPMGDLALSISTIQREACEQQKILEHHLCHLIVHGMLHLLGYDHAEEDEAEVMEALECSILDPMGIKNPYIIVEKDTSS